MAFNLFACCWPGGAKQRGNKVSYSELHQNGAFDNGANNGESRILQNEGPRHDLQGSNRSSPAKGDTVRDTGAPTIEVPEAEHTPRERATPVALVAPPQESSQPISGRAGYTDGSSTKGAANITTITHGNVRPQIPRGGYGSSVQTLRPPYPPSSMRQTGPRMMHAHPHDYRQGWGLGADNRSVVPRIRPQNLAPNGQGGGRFGAVVFTAAGAGGARVSAARGFARAIPGASRSVLAKYEMKEVLGVGSTSTCYRCVNRTTQEQFACKVIDKRAMELKLKPLLAQFQVEIQILRTLRHPNIIHMEAVFESSTNIHMVMELMVGGELFDYVVEKGTLNEKEASVMVRKVTSALAYMHSLDIIHRDLKPENLLLTSKDANAEVKVIDFGLAKILGANDNLAQSFLGTRGYLAPEMLQRQAYTKAIDVWALGVIVFVLLCGCLPFDDDSKKLNRAGAMQKFVLRFPKWAKNLSSGAKNLLSQLLTVTPEARITAQEALEHPWVTGQAAAPDNFLESPRTLRKLSCNSAPKGAEQLEKEKGDEGADAAGMAATATEVQRRAEFEEQCTEYLDNGSNLEKTRPRKNSV